MNLLAQRLPELRRAHPRALHGHGRRELPADHARHKRARLSPRARAAARDECILEYGFDPRLTRHPEAPKTRGECQGHEGRCPWLACRNHLALDVRPTSAKGHPSSLRLTFGGEDIDAWPEQCCCLDVVDIFAYPEGGRGVMTFAQIAKVMMITKERARQIYASGALKFLQGCTSAGVDPILVLEWLEGSSRTPPAKPSPIRRAQVFGSSDDEDDEVAPARPRLSPQAAARRRQELMRAEQELRETQVREARERAARTDAERSAAKSPPSPGCPRWTDSPRRFEVPARPQGAVRFL